MAIKQAERICSIYHEASNIHNKKAFEAAFTECMNRRTSVPSLKEYEERKAQNMKLFENEQNIALELERQARQYMCEEERIKLDNFKKKMLSSMDSDHPNLLKSLQKRFSDCVEKCTSEQSVHEYQEAGMKGMESLFEKQERNFELAQATRLHFSF